jgi:curved DNA-binding protein CbpA
MKTPYEILGVTVDASDVEIKQAYLQKVKDNPPDRDQEQFQIIHTAYTSIKDSKSRMSYALFNVPTPDFDDLLDHALATGQPIRIKPEQFIKLLRAGIDNTTVLSAIPYAKKS